MPTRIQHGRKWNERPNAGPAEFAEHEALFRLLFDSSADAIVIFDPALGAAVDCNEAAVKLSRGGTRPWVLSQPVPAPAPEHQPNGVASRDRARELIEAALTLGPQRFEWLARGFNGEEFPVVVLLAPVRAGGRTLLVSISRDVTDDAARLRREKIQQATFEISEAVHVTEDLPRLYARLHAIIKTLMPADNFYIASLNADGKSFGFPYLVDQYDRSTAPLRLDQGLTGYVLRRGKPLLAGPHNSVTPGGRLRVIVEDDERIEAIFFGPAAASVWLGVPLINRGRTFGVVAMQDYENPRAYGEEEKRILMFVAGQIAQAIERKRAEEELLRSLAREKELGQMKSNFVAMVSHEFRTPLGVIQSSSEILADYLDKLDPNDRSEQLRSIVKNTRRMADLMEEVLLLGRLDAGKMDFQPAALDVRAFCQRVVDELLTATGQRCPITLDCATVPEEFCGDERLLRRIFTNLLANAVKFSEAGSPVLFKTGVADGELVFSVHDCGVGIPEADLPWLFNAFQRGRNVAHLPGTGLGLTIVKRCVELHGGEIKIESPAGQGTTATVRLPLRAVNKDL
ncbi:MAG: PAS domain-containing sensor histidine kinase [Pedosphaera sp.]|nr:PAS domain-containing sensor histidine kinase [Pedosphaera sp.]